MTEYISEGEITGEVEVEEVKTFGHQGEDKDEENLGASAVEVRVQP